MNILEIGGGTSPEALAVMEQLPDWDIRSVNLDVSYNLLRLLSLHLRYAQPEFHLRCSFICADANELTIGEGLVDLVLISRALHHFDDPIEQLKLCRKRIAPNGLIAVVCELVGSAYDPPSIRLLEKGVNEQLFSSEECLNMFQSAGLELVDGRLDWGFSLKAILEKKDG